MFRHFRHPCVVMAAVSLFVSCRQALLPPGAEVRAAIVPETTTGITQTGHRWMEFTPA